MLSNLDLQAVMMYQTERYLTASALTFVLCDILATFKDEVRLIWRSKWTAAKVLYIASRYLGILLLLVLLQAGGPLDSLGERRRLRIRLTSLVGSWVGFGIVNVITSLRVYALYGRSRNVLYLGITLWAAQLAAGGYAAFRIVLDYAHVLSSISTNCAPCDPLYGIHVFVENNLAYKTRYMHMSAVIVCTLTSIIYLSMTLGKLRDSITDGGGRVRYEVLKEASYATPIAGVFISDGALSLLLLLMVDLATAVCSLDNTMYYYSPTWPWMHAIFSHVGSSLILNLRRAGGRGTPTLIVKRQDETLDLDGVHLVV